MFRTRFVSVGGVGLQQVRGGFENLPTFHVGHGLNHDLGYLSSITTIGQADDTVAATQVSPRQGAVGIVRATMAEKLLPVNLGSQTMVTRWDLAHHVMNQGRFEKTAIVPTVCLDQYGKEMCQIAGGSP